MNYVANFVRRPVLTWMLCLLFVFLGLLGFFSLPVNLLPDIAEPSIRVVAEYPDAGPREVEDEISVILEDYLSTLGGLEKIYSISHEGESEVILTFSWGVNINELMSDVREKLDQARPDLPQTIKDPRIERFNPSSKPMLIIAFSAPSEDKLISVVTGVLQPYLERVLGVARVEIAGLRQRRVLVAANEAKLNAYKIPLLEVKQRLMEENITAQSGKIIQGDRELVVRIDAGIRSIADLENIIIRRYKNSSILLKDVASVKESFSKRTDLARINGASAIEVIVYKESGANTVNIVKEIKSGMDDLLRPVSFIKADYSFDESLYIKQSLQLLKGNASIGVLLAFIILLVFLQKIKTALVVVLSIPVSVISALWLFQIAGISLNLFSLAGIALAMGMVVDNSIVVLENIVRHINEGRIAREACVSGSVEIINSVLASTLTTLAVFIPVLFVSGLIAQLFRDISFAVIFTLSFSLLVSFSLVPMLAARFLQVTDSEKKRNPLDRVGGRILRFYRAILEILVTKKPARLIFTFAVTAAFAVTVKFLPQFAFLPETSGSSIILEGSVPPGTSLEATDKVARSVERQLQNIKGIEMFSSKITQGEFRIVITAGDRRDISAFIGGFKDYLNGIPDLLFSLKKVSALPDIGSGSASKNDLSVLIGGSDLDEIKTAAGEMKGKIKNMPQVRDVRIYPGGELPGIEIRIDREKAALKGLSSRDVSAALKLKIGGEKVNTMKGGEEMDIFVKSALQDISPADISEISLLNAFGQPVLLKDIAKIEIAPAPSAIERQEKQRIYTIGIDLKESRSLGAVMVAADKEIKRANRNGLSYCIGGSGESMKESFLLLTYALGVALLLIYMIMAAQFESLLHPFIIMFTFPASLIGAVAALYLSGETMNITSLLGIIMLAGIVVNNAIMLVSYINILRSRGVDMPRALVIAGQTRVRPIMMTTLTTVLGMLPLAMGLGSGAELYRPLAIVVVGGLSISTVLTLFYIPVAYMMIDEIKESISLVRLKLKYRYVK